MDKIIAVTGEGPADYGRMVYEKERGNYWEWGPVGYLLKRCLEDYHASEDIGFEPVQKEQVKSMKLLRSDKGLKGLSIPARKFVRYCRENDLGHGIFYADSDKRENSAKTQREAQQHFQEVYNEVREGLEMDEQPSFIPMIALKMIECWLLADAKAFEACYGCAPSLPRNPELIWGDKRNPDSDYPKHFLDRILSGIPGCEGRGHQEIFCNLAEQIDTGTLRERCGISFEQFYRDFGKLLES